LFQPYKREFNTKRSGIMKKPFMVLLIYILLCLCPSLTHAQSLYTVKVLPSPKDSTGRTLQFSITGDTQGHVAYLGCSFYPSKYSNKLKEGYHDIVQVSNSFTRSWEIPEKFYEGSFEIAIWGDKVLKARCGRKDCFLCGKFGFHLEKMLDFCSGTLLPTNPVTLQVSTVPGDGYVTVTVNGATQNGGAYLGVSFYPKDCKDLLKEGKFDCRRVYSSFSEIWTVPDKYRGGRYEIALWNRKINKSDCRIKSCFWCRKLGYHLWWLLFLKSGVIY